MRTRYILAAFLLFLVFTIASHTAFQRTRQAVTTTAHSISLSEMKRIVWREDVYDRTLKASVSVLKIDETYFSSVTEPEKAVLGYLASTIGNECFEDGGRQNVKCKLLTALNMGYQCSETNKTFLRGWFRDDAAIVKQIENCTPTIAKTVEKTFDEVKISSTENEIKVSLKGLKLNIKENSSSKWSENLTFKLNGDKLTLIERTKNE